jgi:hypothetical protein
VNEAAGWAQNLPTGALTIRLKQTMISALRDGLTVAQSGIEFLEAKYGEDLGKKETVEEEEGNLGPPEECGAESEWTSRIGMETFR